MFAAKHLKRVMTLQNGMYCWPSERTVDTAGCCFKNTWTDSVLFPGLTLLKMICCCENVTGLVTVLMHVLMQHWIALTVYIDAQTTQGTVHRPTTCFDSEASWFTSVCCRLQPTACRASAI